jgi:hypothetical protein
MITCRGCGQEIRFEKTVRGKLMPCDPQIVTTLNLDGEIRTGYIPHFVTCSESGRFRKPRKENKDETIPSEDKS